MDGLAACEQVRARWREEGHCDSGKAQHAEIADAPCWRYLSHAPTSTIAMSQQPGALDLYPPSRTGWFEVPRDHFRYDVSGSTTFAMKYLVYDGFAAHNTTAPVLCYCGNEGAVELFYNNSGALFSLA